MVSMRYMERFFVWQEWRVAWRRPCVRRFDPQGWPASLLPPQRSHERGSQVYAVNKSSELTSCWVKRGVSRTSSDTAQGQ